MKKNYLKIIIFVFLTLLILVTTAFAANWIFATKVEGAEGDIPSNEYIDANSVVRDGNNLYFWELSIEYKADGHTEYDYTLSKYEVRLDTTPYKDRRKFICRYNPDGNPKVPIDSEPHMWRNVWGGSAIDTMINTALKYAKSGKDQNNARPPEVTGTKH